MNKKNLKRILGIFVITNTIGGVFGFIGYCFGDFWEGYWCGLFLMAIVGVFALLEKILYWCFND